jgi:hypothetical protein
MIEQILNICRSIYDVFIYKVVKYYDPIIDKKVYTRKNNILDRYNMFRQYSDVDFIYKLLNVDYNDNIYFNSGIVYHTSIQDLNNVLDRDIISFNDDIISIKIKLLSNANKSEYIIIDEKFISHILNFATPTSRLKPLIYYYLQNFLSNYDHILEVELETNDKYNKVNMEDTLEDLIKS